MKIKTVLATTTLALIGSVALAAASPLFGNPPYNGWAAPGYRLAQNEQHHHHHHERVLRDEWYQGQPGHWYQHGNQWRWRGADGDTWHMGQQGHWYQEANGYQFGTAGMVCNDNGRNCHEGGYLPPNGEGMVDRANPNLFWQCDSQGHHCHWQQRPRY